MIKKYEDTICWKINRTLQELEEVLKTKNLDVPTMAKRLHKMRLEAQKMEDALKLRKKMMEEAGIEEEYQKRKDKAYTPTPKNKLGKIEEERPSKDINFEFTVKDNGKLVYQALSKAGVFSTVESIEDIDNTGAINGKTQLFTWGHPLSIWFAFDQLGQGIEGKRMEILAAIKQSVGSGMLDNPEEKKRILRLLNSLPLDKDK